MAKIRASFQDRPLYRPDEFCEIISVSRATCYRMLNAGELKSVRISNKRLIPRSEIDRIVGEAT